MRAWNRPTPSALPFAAQPGQLRRDRRHTAPPSPFDASAACPRPSAAATDTPTPCSPAGDAPPEIPA